MSLHNGTIYRWNRPVYAAVDGHAAPAGGEPGPPGRARRSPTPIANAAFYYGLVRALAEAQRPIWTQMSFATAAANHVHAAARSRHGRAALLAWSRRGRRRRNSCCAWLRTAGQGGTESVAGQPGPGRPPARHHRAALPDRPDRRGVAGCHGRRAHRRRWRGSPRSAAAHDPALHRAHARGTCSSTPGRSAAKVRRGRAARAGWARRTGSGRRMFRRTAPGRRAVGRTASAARGSRRSGTRR